MLNVFCVCPFFLICECHVQWEPRMPHSEDPLDPGIDTLLRLAVAMSCVYDNRVDASVRDSILTALSQGTTLPSVSSFFRARKCDTTPPPLTFFCMFALLTRARVCVRRSYIGPYGIMAAAVQAVQPEKQMDNGGQPAIR